MISATGCRSDHRAASRSAIPGSNLDHEDSAILVENGRRRSRQPDRGALFGIYLKTGAPAASSATTSIIGKHGRPARMRGDGIKIWYCDDVVIENNRPATGETSSSGIRTVGIVRGQ